MLSDLVWKFSRFARGKRAAIFRDHFEISKDTKLLDLGSENGQNVFNLLSGCDYDPKNIFIADIDPDALEQGHEDFGFSKVLIAENEPLPFPDKFFDIVFCSSVIEHVTIPKSQLWNVRSGREFRQRSLERQKEFAGEIARLGHGYFVQTPAKSFPIESHTWLPLMGYLPRRLFLPILSVTNRVWIKSAPPDFNLLTKSDMRYMFPDGTILDEGIIGITKSIMALRKADR